MKTITSLILVLVFSLSVMAKGSFPELKSIAKLSDIKEKKTLNQISPNIFKEKRILSLSKATDNKPSKKANKFTFSINPYLWTVAVGGDVSIPQIDKTFSFNVSFSDAIKNLKMAFMVNGKFKYDRVSLLYDIVYYKLKNFGATLPVDTIQYTGKTIGKPVSANTTITNTIMDLALAYVFPQQTPGFSLTGYLGTRIWMTNNGITLIDSTGKQDMLEADKTWVDPILGLNGEWVLSKHWGLDIKGDIGGFGVNSQFTLMLATVVAYRVSDNFNILGGIKYLGVNYVDSGYETNLNQYGFVLGVGLRL